MLAQSRKHWLNDSYMLGIVHERSLGILTGRNKLLNSFSARFESTIQESENSTYLIWRFKC